MSSKAKERFPNYESICLQCGTTIYKPIQLTNEEITEGFKAIDQLGLEESIVQQQALEIERLKGHLAVEAKIRLELVEENKALKATIAQMTIDGGKELKPAKYTDAWWKEVEEFNKQLKEQQ